MRSPVLLAVDDDPSALENVETQLAQRYVQEYRVVCLADASSALQVLSELAENGEEVALVLAAESLSRPGEGELLEQARQLHPHAKRAMLVPPDAWTDPSTADAIRSSMALGRIDYYVPRPR